jgi:hypothetical protein
VLETRIVPDLDTQQKSNVVFLSDVVNSGARWRLKAQPDASIDTASPMADWLRQRHAAMAHMQHLAVHLYEPTDPAKALKTQQAWATGALYCFVVDAAAFYVTTLQFWDNVWSRRTSDTRLH